MSGPSSTSAAISNASNAAFQTWVNEVYTGLVTNGGLRQLPAAMDSGQMAVPCVTAVPGGASTSAGYYMFAFTDPLALGPLSTVAAIAGGSGYNGGVTHTFTSVPLTGGLGSGAQATIVCTSGAVTSVTITTAGTGYGIGDQLSASSANLGGSGSGFACYVNALTFAAAPVVIKWEAGTGAAAAGPQMWVTIAQGWTSNGTLSGSAGTTAMTRVSCLTGSTPISLINPYTSRYNYNNTLGFCACIFKIGSVVLANFSTNLGSFIIFRTNDSSGNPTGNAVCLLTSSFSAANIGASQSLGFMQCLSYGSATVYPALTAAAASSYHGGGIQDNNANGTIFNLTTTLESGTVFAFPILTMDPVIRMNAFVCEVLPLDVPVGVEFSTTIIGSTALNFLNIGFPFGNNSISSAAAALNTAILWQ